MPGDHASTFGGNPVACAAACAVVDAIDDELLARVRDAAPSSRDGLARCPPSGGARRRPAARRRARPPGRARGRGVPRARAARRLGRRARPPADSAARRRPRRGRRGARRSSRGACMTDKPRAPGRDPAARPRARDLDADRARRGAARRRLRRRADDRLPRHRRARLRKVRADERPARLRAAGGSERRPACASSALALRRWALDVRGRAGTSSSCSRRAATPRRWQRRSTSSGTRTSIGTVAGRQHDPRRRARGRHGRRRCATSCAATCMEGAA